MAVDRFSHMTDQEIDSIKSAVTRYKHELQYQRFPEQYFTGADTTIYFGDTWVAELTALEYNIIEQVKPVHGYASYTWDKPVRGSRVVQGSFRIAFNEAGYLYVILDHLGFLKKNAKPRLAYLMGGEQVPDWIAGVKEDIENVLYRYHGNKNAKEDDKTITTERKEKYLDEFEWDTLQLNQNTPMTDAKYPNKKGRKRMGSSGNDKYTINKSDYLGQISQLQARLKELGYGWPDWTWQNGSKKGKPIDFPVNSRPSANHAAASFRYPIAAIFGHFGDPAKKGHPDWLLLNRYVRRANGTQYTLGGEKYDFKNEWDLELQMRLDDYPGALEGLFMGGKWGTFDGRYGDLFAKGVNLFQDLAQVPAKHRAANGNYLTTFVYNELKKGLKVNGVFDTPTMIAVKLFQKRNGLPMTGVVDSATRKKLSPTVSKTVKETHTEKGKNWYNPENLYEPRAAKYEAEIWGRVSSADDNHRRRTFFYHGMAGDEYIKENGFDIYATFGPYPEKVIGQAGQMATKLPETKINFNTTVKAIRNIQLTGSGIIMDNSGNPIEEVYTFIAQDLD